jgi:hypothetical protein
MKITVGGRLVRPMRDLQPTGARPPKLRVNVLGEEFGRLALEAEEDGAAVRELWVGPVEAPRPRPGPWRRLFDGRTLNGWTRSGGKAHYEARGGEIVGQTRPNTPNTFLATVEDFDDFEFECEVHGVLRFNGGIQFRSEPRDGKNKERGTRGYQYELDPSGRAWSAGIYDEARRSWLHPLAFWPERRQKYAKEGWHHVRIVAVGSAIKTYLNQRLTAHIYDAMTPRGYFGLQVHSVGKRTEPMEIRWRNLRIRPMR